MATERAPITSDARRARLSAQVRDAATRKGALLIAAFAVERTRELIVDPVDLMERGEVPAAPIFLDSPHFRWCRIRPASHMPLAAITM